MSNITLSAGIRQNLLSLQDTAANLTTTQEHLSTGKKINTAFDNPTSYFTSQSLNNRANDLSALAFNREGQLKSMDYSQSLPGLDHCTARLIGPMVALLSPTNRCEKYGLPSASAFRSRFVRKVRRSPTDICCRSVASLLTPPPKQSY